MLLETSFVHGLDGPDRHFRIVYLDYFFVFQGIHGMDGFLQASFRAQKTEFLGVEKQFVSEIRVRQADHGNGSFLEALSKKIDRPVFAHHVIHVAPGYDYRHILEDGHNPAVPAIPGSGGDHEYRLASGRLGRSPYEVEHSRHAGIMVVRARIHCHLPGQIHHTDNVERHHPVVGCDDSRIVHIVGGMEFNAWIVVKKLVKVSGSDGKTGHQFPLIQSLDLVGDDALAGEFHESVGKDLRMDSEIILVPQGLQHGMGDAPQADLQGGAVIYEPGYVLGNGKGGDGFGHRTDAQQFFVVFNHYIDIVHVYEAVAQNPGHPGIDLGDDQVGGPGCREGNIYGDAQADPAEVVRRRNLDESDMNGYLPALKKMRHGGQVDGCKKPAVFSQAFGDGGAGIEGPDAEALGRGLGGDQGQGSSFEAEQSYDLDVREIHGLPG